MSLEQIERLVADEFATIRARLDKLDEAIRGNGKPGIQLRLDRLESAEATRSKLLWIIAGAIVPLTVATTWKLLIGG